MNWAILEVIIGFIGLGLISQLPKLFEGGLRLYSLAYGGFVNAMLICTYYEGPRPLVALFGGIAGALLFYGLDQIDKHKSQSKGQA
jgi:hypothetical protein